MRKKEIADKILDIVCNKFKIEKKEITTESTIDSFGIDSLDLVEIIIEIEDDFKIIFPDNIAFKFYIMTSTTVGEFIVSIVDYVDMVVNKNK